MTAASTAGSSSSDWPPPVCSPCPPPPRSRRASRAVAAALRRRPAGAESATNPLGVAADAPLEVVIFNGGYGDDYAKATRRMYGRSTRRRRSTTRPPRRSARCCSRASSPTTRRTCVDNCGAETTRPTPPSSTRQAHRPHRAARRSRRSTTRTRRSATPCCPASIEHGTFDGKFHGAQLRLRDSTAIWYSKPLFAKNGWTRPTTWDEMMTLSETDQGRGHRAVAYGGTYAAEYMNDLQPRRRQGRAASTSSRRSTTWSRTPGSRRRSCRPPQGDRGAGRRRATS